MSFSLLCGTWKGLTELIMHTLYAIPTAQSFWIMFHVTDPSHVSVHSQSLVFSRPLQYRTITLILNARCTFCSLHYLFVMGLPLRAMSLKILHTILPHAVNSSRCLPRIPPTRNEFLQLKPASHSEIILKHKPPVWTTAPVDPTSLTGRWC